MKSSGFGSSISCGKVGDMQLKAEVNDKNLALCPQATLLCNLPSMLAVKPVGGVLLRVGYPFC